MAPLLLLLDSEAFTAEAGAVATCAELRSWLAAEYSLLYVDRLRFFAAGSALGDADSLPSPPVQVLVEGPAVVLAMLRLALKRAGGIGRAQGTAAGSRRPAASAPSAGSTCSAEGAPRGVKESGAAAVAPQPPKRSQPPALRPPSPPRGRAVAKLEARCFPNHLKDNEPHVELGSGRSLRLKASQDAVVLEVLAGEGRLTDESTYTGCPGVAYLLAKLAALEGGEAAAGWLATADGLLARSRRRLESAPSAIQCSLLCGLAGQLCISALRLHVSGRVEEARQIANEYAALAAIADTSRLDADEWLYGRAGFLHGCLLLNHVLGPGAVSEASADAVAARALRSGEEYAKKKSVPGLLWKWMGAEYLGAAHGVFGIVFMLLHFPSIAHNPLLVETLDWLISLETPYGNWPSVRRETDDPLVHFCHGAPGAALCLCKAYEILGECRFLDAAVRAAECTWRYGLLFKGPGLCHGIAGNAYVFLAMYRVTQEPLWLRRAHAFAEFMLEGSTRARLHTPDNPLSLFEGLAGTACFLLDLRLRPTSAAFPLFELGGF